MRTYYEQYKALETNYDKMRFFFKNAIGFRDMKVTKAKEGVYVKGILDKQYAEIDYDGRFILFWKVVDGKIGHEPIREIDLDEFEANLKRQHDLIKGGE